MAGVESTPEMAAKVYATMSHNLEVVRRRLSKPLTLAEKILLGHLDDPVRQELEPGKSYLSLRPDHVVFQDVLGQTGMLQFMQTGRDKVAVPTTIHCDHLIEARRNDGHASTMNFIASPEIVTAFALAGKLSFNPLVDSLTGSDGNSFRLQAPKQAPEVPEKRFETRGSFYVAPRKQSANIEIKVDPQSQRIQLLEPWPAWDGKDFVDLPVLVKTQGKTTTDHISPAGPWLSLRGHLDKFSENMFMGATNAFTGETGKGKNVVTGEKSLAFSTIARHYKAQGIKWVVIGDHNYGEGSSREHAALSPRLLAGSAVIARSFARIHESNLKKQGLLALTFCDPGDYEKIHEDSRISLLGLADMTAGSPIKCIVKTPDRRTKTLWLAHSYSATQLEWFRAGSALNLVTRV